ncbi:hypothetical protein T492DRAFT_883016, partial [Pavlovales sp. CCMP2436]
MPCPDVSEEVDRAAAKVDRAFAKIPSFSQLSELLHVAGHTGEPVWVWALWRPCLVAIIFVAILFRFLEAFSTGPPEPWVLAPLLFTVCYIAMLYKAVPQDSSGVGHPPGSAGFCKPGSTGRSRFGGLDLAAVERWQYALNLHQLLVSTWVCVSLVLEVRELGMQAWGNKYDPSPRAYRLGWLIWVIYSNRYLQGLDTLFLLLRDK